MEVSNTNKIILPKTKIVATFGPACSDEKLMEKMVESGVTCFRLNTAHSSTDELMKLVEFRNRMADERKRYVSIMVDLKGPELRAVLGQEKIEILEGKEYSLGQKGEKVNISIAVDGVISSLKKGDVILFMDGKIRTEVVNEGDRKCTIRSSVEGTLKNNGRMNIPGRYIPMGILQERDKEYLKLSVEHKVEFVALSFVQNRKEIDMVHDMISDMGGNIQIISKIETKQALDNLDGIVKASDALMVARGDLGVEMPLHEVSVSQKFIMKRAHSTGLPIIVATQMLESMVSSESPTRAEISDVTNAILDNTDALMLSEETAIGQFPLEAVQVLRDTSLYVEEYYCDFSEPAEFTGSKITFSVARSTKLLSDQIKAHHIVAFTRGGNTARMVSSMRPRAGIIAATPSRLVACRINLYRGIYPYVLKEFRENISVNEVLNLLLESNLIRKGERIVVISGHPEHLFAGTAQVSILTAGKLVARGYVLGPSISGKVNEGKGSIFVGSEEDLSRSGINQEEYSGFIIRGNVRRTLINRLQEMGKTCIYSTIVLQEVKKGEIVFIDSDIGFVYA
ncbi:MAG: pyruvate kinase [Cuniculiplasma sp.]